ncbi:MAG: hypothetical protein WA144_12670 [Candidatus Methanoperedens sp.]
MAELNYKNIHFWLLSFFGILVILALTGQIKSTIDSDFIKKYCLFGIIICLISWNFEIKIINKTKDYLFQEYMISKILGELDKNRWILLGILGITFIFNQLAPDVWFLIYGLFFFIYFILMLWFELLK